MPRVCSKTDWRKFEVESWRRAIREHGLQLRFLDAEQQQALLETMCVPVVVRYRAGRRVWRRISGFARRLTYMALLIALGYFLHNLGTVASRVGAAIVASSGYDH